MSLYFHSTPVDEQHNYTSLNIFKDENNDIDIKSSQSSKQFRGNNHSAALLILLVIACVSILILILLILIMYAHLAISINSIRKSLHTRQKSIISTLNETEINGLEKLYSMVSGLSLYQSDLYHNTTEDIINTIIYRNSSKLPPSCADIFKSAPSSASGYYRIRSSTHNDVTVYCDMTRTCGNITEGWTIVSKLDMNVPSVPQCPQYPSALQACVSTTLPYQHADRASMKLAVFPLFLKFTGPAQRSVGRSLDIWWEHQMDSIWNLIMGPLMAYF